MHLNSEYTQNHRILHFKWVNLMLGELYLNKSILFFLFFIFFNVYLFLRQRETEHEWGRVRKSEGDTESETGSRL